jgi:hypothetical protein
MMMKTVGNDDKRKFFIVCRATFHSLSLYSQKEEINGNFATFRTLKNDNNVENIKHTEVIF